MDAANNLPRVLQRVSELVLAVVVLVGLFALLGAVVSEAGLDLPIQFTPDPEAYTLSSDAWGSGTILDSEGIARFDDRDGRLTALFVAGVLTYTVPAVAVLLLLRGLLQSIAGGGAFTQKNTVALRWIGGIVAVYGLVATVVRSLIAAVGMNELSASGLHVEARLEPDLAVVFAGLLVIVLAEVFATGAHLQADADLTV